MRALLAAALAILALSTGAARVAPAGPTIYSSRADDPWNRIFALLFTRDFDVRFTSEFGDRGPFEDQPHPALSGRVIRVSTRTFNRHEDGDRAVEALYPVFMSDRGLRAVLEDPRYADLSTALTDALSDRSERSGLARALMQIDLWSALDRLDAAQRPHRPADISARAAALSSLMARLIRRIALTRSEIAGLPDNYEAARRSLALPDAFRAEGEWLEVSWAPFHMHDQAADQRRVTRTFMRPRTKPADVPSFLKAVTREYPPKSFDQVALVTRAMLVDREGHVVASPVATDVQVRVFSYDPRGAFVSTTTVEHELSRRRLLTRSSSGGFVAFDDGAEGFLPTAGNDYEFATPVLVPPGRPEPIVSTLRERCAGCHGPNGAHIVSFAVHDPAGLPPPRALPQPNDDRARAVAAAKEARDDYKRLIAAAFNR